MENHNICGVGKARRSEGVFVSVLDGLSDIRKLIILQTIIDVGSLRKAANQLKVTPSAISQSLSALEKQLGKTMIIRDQGQFRITEDCHRILDEYRPAIDALAKVTLQKKESSGQIAKLNLGTYESLGIDILPSLVQDLRRDHPDAKLNFIIGRSGSILKKLRSGELCVALVIETDGTEGFHSIEVSTDELGLYVSVNSPFATKPEEAVEQLGIGVMSPGPEGYPTYFSRFLRSLGKPKVSMTSDSFEVLRAAALSGSIVAVLPKKLAARTPGELIEIHDRPEELASDNGFHRIMILWQDHCDPDEAKYLAELASRHY